MTDTDMLYMAAVTKENEDLKQLLRKVKPVLKAAIFVNYKETRKADELYEEIVKIVGKGGDPGD